MLLWLLVLSVCCKIVLVIREVLDVRWWFEICRMSCFVVSWLLVIVRVQIHMFCKCRFSCAGCFDGIFVCLLFQLISITSPLFSCLLLPMDNDQYKGLWVLLFYTHFPNRFFFSGFWCLSFLFLLLSGFF